VKSDGKNHTGFCETPDIFLEKESVSKTHTEKNNGKKCMLID
jgi:hypothetical protein